MFSYLLPLSEDERHLVNTTLSGQRCEFDATRSRPSIRGEVIALLLMGASLAEPNGPVPSVNATRLTRGIRLKGAAISGCIDLKDAAGQDSFELPPLILEDCHFTGPSSNKPDAPEMRKPDVDCSHARIRRLSFNDCRFAYIDLSNAVIGGDLDIRKIGPVPDGGKCWVKARDSRIRGNVKADGAKLHVAADDTMDPDGRADYALDLMGAHIDSKVVVGPAAEVHGGICLRSAVVGGDLLVINSVLTGDNKRKAFDVTNAALRSSVFLVGPKSANGGCTRIGGSICFLNADVGGDLVTFSVRPFDPPASEPDATGTQSARNAITPFSIDAKQIKVAGGVLLGLPTESDRGLADQTAAPASRRSFECNGWLDFSNGELLGNFELMQANVQSMDFSNCALRGNFRLAYVNVKWLSFSNGSVGGDFDVSMVDGQTDQPFELYAPGLRVGHNLTISDGHSFMSAWLRSSVIDGSLKVTRSRIQRLFLDLIKVLGTTTLKTPEAAISGDGGEYKGTFAIEPPDVAANAQDREERLGTLTSVSLVNSRFHDNLIFVPRLAGEANLRGIRVWGDLTLDSNEGFRKLTPAFSFYRLPSVTLDDSVIEGDLRIAIDYQENREVKPVSAISRKMKCYKNWTLYEFHCKLSDPSSGMQVSKVVAALRHDKDEIWVPLDGQSARFHSLNSESKYLTLNDQESIDEYVRLFVAYTFDETRSAAFLVIDEKGGDRTERNQDQTDKPIRLTRTLLYQHDNKSRSVGVFKVDLELTMQGDVTMISDNFIRDEKSVELIERTEAPFRFGYGYKENSQTKLGWTDWPLITPFKDGYTKIEERLAEELFLDFRAYCITRLPGNERPRQLNHVIETNKFRFSLRGAKCGALDDKHGCAWAITEKANGGKFSFERISLDLEGFSYSMLDDMRLSRSRSEGQTEPTPPNSSQQMVDARTSRNEGMPQSRFQAVINSTEVRRDSGPADSHWKQSEADGETVGLRRGWLLAQYESLPPTEEQYSPQPWEEIYARLRQHGNEAAARGILLEKLRLERSIRTRAFRNRTSRQLKKCIAPMPRIVRKKLDGLRTDQFREFRKRISRWGRKSIKPINWIGWTGQFFGKPITHFLEWVFDVLFLYGLSSGRAVVSCIVAIVIGWHVTDWANTGAVRLFPIYADPSNTGLVGLGTSTPYKISDRPALVVDSSATITLKEMLDSPESNQASNESPPSIRDTSGHDGVNPARSVPEIACGDQIEPFLYAVDVFVPFLDLRQESKCTIASGDEFWLWRLVKAIYAILGSIFIPITVLSIATGLRRRIVEH